MAKERTEKTEETIEFSSEIDILEFPVCSDLVSQAAALVAAVTRIRQQYNCAARSTTNLLFAVRDSLQGGVTDPIIEECAGGRDPENNLSSLLCTLHGELCTLVEELNFYSRQTHAVAYDLKESLNKGDEGAS